MQTLHVNGYDMAYLEVARPTEERRSSACTARSTIFASGAACSAYCRNSTGSLRQPPTFFPDTGRSRRYLFDRPQHVDDVIASSRGWMWGRSI